MTLIKRAPLAGFAMGLAALSIGMAHPALAQNAGIDITRMTCAQLSDMPRGEQEQFLTWLYGYYAGAAQKAVIDRGGFLASTRALGEYCDKQKTTPLISAQIREIFLPGSQAGASSTANDAARGAGASSPNVLAPGTEGAQRITIPPAAVFDPSTTSALPLGGSLPALVPPPPAPISILPVPTRPTPQ